MKRYLKYLLPIISIFIIVLLMMFFVFKNENYVTENSTLFETLYYPSKNLQILDENTREEYANKITIKNTTEQTYFYQIKIEGDDTSDCYLQYQKNEEQLSDIIYLENIGKEQVIIRSQKMNPLKEDTYLFYIYSKDKTVKNLTFKVEEIVIPTDNIKDTTPPTITLLGEKIMTVKQNSVFVDPGVSKVMDNYDGNISLEKVVTRYRLQTENGFETVEKIDTSLLGTYYIYYQVNDKAQNERIVIRTVNVVSKETDQIEEELKVNISYSTKNQTKDPVNVTISAEEALVPIGEWHLSSDELSLTKTFPSNAELEMIITSKSGKSVFVTISIQNIDKSELNTPNIDPIIPDLPQEPEIIDPTEEEILLHLNKTSYGTNYIHLNFTSSFDEGILEYQYTCDGNSWMKTTSKNIECNQLIYNTTYIIQVKAVSKKNNIYYSNIISQVTLDIPSASFTEENLTSSKKITINFPSNISGLSYFYKTTGEWIETKNTTVTLDISSNLTIYTKITDATNTVEDFYVINTISSSPIINNKNINLNLTPSNHLTITWEKATSTTFSSSQLLYYVCLNKDANTCFSAPDAVVADIDQFQFDNLTQNTSYIVSVYVQDPLGNSSAYFQTTITTHDFYDIANKEDLVAIMYSTWFNPVVGDGTLPIYNISNILAGTSPWGPENAFHYWAKPALGYYRSDNKNVIRTHMLQLEEAGIDFIIIDNTNANRLAWGYGSGSYWEDMVNTPLKALLDTIREMRDEGLNTPYVVNWIGTHDGSLTTETIYQDFYTIDDYADLWVYWNGSPFILTTGNITNSNITLRKMWGLQPSLSTQEWSYLQINNDKPAYSSNGTIEQIGVSIAMQRSYMSDTSTAVGRNHGITFYNQWLTAFKYYPKVVTITWWNEWIAQRLYVNGKYYFTDNYNQEYSRDIEPMEGGHGDQYYQWLKQYISAYKNHASCPRLVESGY